MKYLGWMITVLLVTGNVMYSQWESTTTVAVVPMESQSAEVDTESFTLQFQNTLSQQKAFVLLERAKLQQILKEQQLEMGGVVDEQEFTKIGQLLGAQKLILAKVTHSGKIYVLTIDGVDVTSGVIEYSDSVQLDNPDLIPHFAMLLADRFVKLSSGESLKPISRQEIRTIQKKVESQLDSDQRQAHDDLEYMIKKRVFMKDKALKQMARKAEILDYKYREQLVRTHHKSTMLTLGMNIVVPSSGTWYSGNYWRALYTTVGFYTSAGLSLFSDNLALTIVGLAGAAYFYVDNIISPVKWVKKRNKNLKESLGVYSYQPLPGAFEIARGDQVLYMPLFSSSF